MAQSLRPPFHGSREGFRARVAPAIDWVLSRLAVACAKTLFATLRRRLNYHDPATSPYVRPSKETFIYCVWHDSLLAPSFLGRQPATTALVGRHQDGGVLAATLAAIGIESARGSSSRGGAAALRQLLAETAGRHIVLTPDGPRGPRREMKPGIAYLAAKTGKPVVPTAFVYRSAWSIGAGWTDLSVPKPFTTVHAYAGEPIHVPESTDREQLDEYAQKIQTAMDALDERAKADCRSA